jgi:predicted transposase/invertase (TIGR01784 family)
MHTGNELNLSPLQQKKFGKTRAGELYPEYYIINVNSFNDVATDTLDEWIYYLKNNRIKDEFKAQGLDKARTILSYDLLSPAEKKTYDRSLDNSLGEKSAINTAREEGKEEGEKEGRKKGKEEGRKEVVLNSLRSGLSPEMISSITGLSVEEIQSIIQSGEI